MGGTPARRTQVQQRVSIQRMDHCSQCSSPLSHGDKLVRQWRPISWAPSRGVWLVTEAEGERCTCRAADVPAWCVDTSKIQDTIFVSIWLLWCFGVPCTKQAGPHRPFAAAFVTAATLPSSPISPARPLARRRRLQSFLQTRLASKVTISTAPTACRVAFATAHASKPITLLRFQPEPGRFENGLTGGLVCRQPPLAAEPAALPNCFLSFGRRRPVGQASLAGFLEHAGNHSGIGK